MNRIPEYFQFKRYHITPMDVVQLAFHCAAEFIQRRVVLMPSWRIDIFMHTGAQITEITPDSVYLLELHGERISVIRSGIGAPLTGDTLLALGCTPCEAVIFTGSAGGLGEVVQIGDLVVVERSFCGDGFSRYLQPKVIPGDTFGQSVEPDLALKRTLKECTVKACRTASALYHAGNVFSTDSIMGQFFRLDHLVEHLDCIAIEMETAAFFNAARLVGIKAGALLEISDLPGRDKNLFAGRTEQEKDRYRAIRRDVLSHIVLDSILSVS